MCTSVRKTPVVSIVWLPICIVLLGGCGMPAQTTQAADDSAESATGITLTYKTLTGAGEVLTATNAEGDMEITLSGVSDNGTLVALTSLVGQSADVAGFSADFSDGVLTTISLPSMQILVEAQDASTYLLTLQGTGTAAQSRTDLESITFETGAAYRTQVVELALDDCYDNWDCSPEVECDLYVLDDILMVQTMVNYVFEVRCIDTQEFTAGACFELLGAVDALGTMMDAIVATNPNLPAEVQNLCFNLAGECPDGTTTDGDLSGDTTDSTTGSSGSTTETDDATEVSVTIQGADEVAVGGSITLSAAASPSTGVYFTWDLLGSGATLGAETGTATTVTGTSVGTVSLAVEARDSEYGNVLATATHTISIVGGAEYVVWYDTGDACWDAPTLKVCEYQYYAEAEPEGTKAIMQGGFANSDEAWSWLCAQISSKFNHAWCSTHYNIGGTYYTLSNRVCDDSSIPSEN